MKTRNLYRFALCFWPAIMAPVTVPAAMLSTEFTYQGRLTAGGAPANGLFDLRLVLYDASTGGNPMGPALTNLNVSVSNGVFTTTLDFGSGLFNGAPYWMDVGIRRGGTVTGFNSLQPRQAITAAPYALYAPNAGAAASASSVPWSGLTGVPAELLDGDADTTYTAGAGLSLNAQQFSVSFGGPGVANSVSRSDHTHAAQDVVSGILADARLSANIARLDAAQTFTGLITFNSPTDEPFSVGNANLVSNLNADFLDGLDAGAFWKLGGNGGTTEGADFLGTTDATALELRVNNDRALRLEPRATSPNVIGGHSGNYAAPAAVGVAILGGGATGSTNEVTDSYGAIGGGRGNSVAATFAVIGGGEGNAILPGASGATIAGGQQNTIQSNAARAVIGGGSGNSIQADAVGAVIAGASRSSIQARAMGAYIGGGSNHTIHADAGFAVLAGGNLNGIRAGGTNAVIGGGRSNLIQTNAGFAVISGGQNNTVQTNALYATIPGGLRASAANYGQMAYASGRFAGDGDAQTSLFVLRGTTSGVGGNTNLFLDGSGQSMTVPLSSSWLYDIMVVGRSSTDNSAGYHIRGLVENNAGTTVLLGTPNKVVLHEDDPAWDVLMEVINNELRIRVIGPSLATTIRWVAKVQTAEVSF